MPLDTRIALGVQPLQVQFRDPIAGYNQLAQLQSADTQNQLAQMQMSASQRAMQEEEGARNFLSSNPDLSTPENQRRLLAFGKTGLAYGKAISEQQKSKGEADKTAAEVLGLNQKNFTAINPPIRAAAGGIPGITAYVEAMYADPVLGTLAAKVKTKEQALKENIEMYTKDPDQWVTAHSNLEGAQMLDALKMNRERTDEAARIASRMPLAAAPVAPPAAAAAPAAAAIGVTKEISPGVRVNSNLSEKDIARVMALSTTGKMDFPGERWTVNPAGNLILEPIPGATAANNLAAPVANVNAMNPNAATMQAINVERTRLEAERNRLLNLRQSKGVQDELKGVEAQLKEINAPVNLRAEGTAFIPGRGMLTAAPASSDLARLMSERAALVASGAALTDNRVVAYDNAITKASAPSAGQPSDLARLMSERAALVASGAALTDNRVVAYDNAITKASAPSAGQPSDVTRLITERNAAVARKAPPDEIAALNAAIKKATTPAQGTTVNVNAGQKAEDVEFGQFVVNQYKEVSARADVATRSLPALDINLKTLEKGFDTGFGTETIAAGAKVLAALGVQNAKDFATDAQTFLANANNAVLQKQLEQKGVQTAADADRITSTGAQLGNTKEANKFILSVAKAQLQRDIAQRKFYSDWRTENKTFRGAEDAWYAGPGGASLFDSPILKKYAEPVAGQAEKRTQKLDEIFKKAP